MVTTKDTPAEQPGHASALAGWLGGLSNQWQGALRQHEEMRAAQQLYRIVPKGTIVMWAGNANDIPAGWALCNGGNNTPNLIERFITASAAPHRQGEAEHHRHSADISPFRANTDHGGSHVHHFPHSWYHRGFYGGRHHGIDTYHQTMNQRPTTQHDSGHSHGVTVDVPAFHTHHAAANRPRWYALCFIMKV